MKLELQRFEYGDDYTVGRLSVDGVFECFVLEDVVRKEGEQKVYGKTAIPTGEYKVKVTYSPKYKKLMPQLLDVPGFEGIRIHSGNTSEDTEGCLLVGTSWTKGNFISGSKAAFVKLFTKLTASCLIQDPILITVK